MLPLFTKGIQFMVYEPTTGGKEITGLKTFTGNTEPTVSHTYIHCQQCCETIILAARHGERVRTTVWVQFGERTLTLEELHITDLEALMHYLQRNRHLPHADYFWHFINLEHHRRYIHNRHTETMLKSVEYAPGKRMYLRDVYQDLLQND